MKEPGGCCTSIKSTLGDEFKLDKFSLTHYPVEDFYKSQWQRKTRSFWWLLYRWCAAGFFIGAVVSSAVEYFGGGTFFIYLTDWGLIACMLTTTYGAVLATMWYFGFVARDDPVKESSSVKVFWALHWATLVMAVVITLMYWAFLFPQDNGMGSNPYNIMQHACNSAVMLLDHMLVAFPSRLLHFIYPAVLGVVYLLFSLIYYFAGGTDSMGNHSIYPILDWQNDPGMAAATSGGALVLVIIFSFLLFWLYKLRRFCYRECFNAPSPHVLPR